MKNIILEVYTKLASYKFMYLEWGCTLHLFVGFRFHFHFVPFTKIINGGVGWCCLRAGGWVEVGLRWWWWWWCLRGSFACLDFCEVQEQKWNVGSNSLDHLTNKKPKAQRDT